MDDWKAECGQIDKKQHPLWRMYPAAMIIVRIVDRFVPEKRRREGLRVYEQIYTGEDAGQRREQDECKIISLLFVITVITLILVAVCTTLGDNAADNVKTLARPQKGVSREMLTAVTDEGERTLDIVVSAARKQGEELEHHFDEAYRCLEKLILGDNLDLMHIEWPLNLVEQIPAMNIEVEYLNLGDGYITAGGELKNKELEEPALMSLDMCLTYFEEARRYSVQLTVYPPVRDQNDIFFEELEERLSEINLQTVYEQELTLPMRFSDRSITWEDKDNSLMVIAGCGVLAVVTVPLMLRDEKRKLLKERSDQLMEDYSLIINKFMLLLVAGMTVRGAWDRICQDYISGKKERRYAYEEMLISRNEIQMGISEIRVIEDFGKRIGQNEYRRFCSIITQNLKHGSSAVLSLLELEASEALEDRKEQARRKGEKAGTRLLLPMLIMLILTMAIVMVPSFMSFSI